MQITILALLPHYLPGYKAGGALRSVEHMVEQLGHPFAFKVVTCDRDDGDREPFPQVRPGEWCDVGKGRAIYLAPRLIGLRRMRRVLTRTEYDVLYLNSLFSPRFTIVPLLLRRLAAVPPRPVVLAPRGELHPGALAQGSWAAWLPRRLAERLPSPRYLKKRLYLRLARGTGLFRGVEWHASTASEAEDIRRHLGTVPVTVAPDLPAPPPPLVPLRARHKEAGTLRVVFLSRIDSKKNLRGAIELLTGLRGQVRFHIYGPVSDARYWAACQAALARLPANVQARYLGPVPHERVDEVFRDNDLFLFPTLGENFGHVVVEALVQGCPVLISDRTPWRRLQDIGAGWDLPLADLAAMRATLQRCLDLPADEYRLLSLRAAGYGRTITTDPAAVAYHRELFRRAAAAGAQEGAA